jgi:uncharacterized protein YjbI with pentapeptide repeats
MLGKDDLTGALFAKASLNGTDFAGSKLAGGKFAEAELSFVKFARLLAMIANSLAERPDTRSWADVARFVTYLQW